MQAQREKNRNCAKKNDYHHRLSRGGYSHLQTKLQEEAFQQMQKEAVDNGIDPSTITREMVPQPDRASMWKLARMKPSGEYVSQSSRDISEKIVSAKIFFGVLTFYTKIILFNLICF